MNCVRHVLFNRSVDEIFTRRLNGCNAVAVISSSAAILAHTPPLPYPTDDPEAGERNIRARMAEVLSLYRQNHTHFPVSRTSLVVEASFGGERINLS